MSDSIDKLKIDVIASSEDATDSLNSLISSLSNLNNVLGNIGKSGSKNGVQSLSNAFKGIQNSISGINTKKLTDAEKVLDSFEKKIADISKSTNKGFNLDGRLNREFENVGRAYREAIEKNTDEAWNNAMFKISELQDNLKHFGKVSNMDTKMPYVEELEAARRAQQKFYVEGAKYDDAFKGRMSKESLGKYGSLFTADKDKATMNITEWLEGIQRNGGELSAELAQSLAAPTDAFRTLAAEVSNFKDKYDNSLVKIDDESAVIPINAIYDAVDVADKAFRSATEQAQLFDNTLKNIGKDIVPSSNATELDRQIASAEKRQQTLLAKKTKADALGDTDSKSYQKLALDIAEVTNQLEVLKQAKDRLASTPVEADSIVKSDVAKTNIANLKQYLQDMLLSTEQIEEAFKRVSVDSSGFWYKDSAGTKRFTTDIATAAGELEHLLTIKEQLNANGGALRAPTTINPLSAFNLSDIGIISNNVKELTAQLNYYKQVVADMNSGAVKFDRAEFDFAKRVISEIALKANELGNEDLFASAMSDANSSASSLNEKLKQIKSNIVASDDKNVLDKQIASAEKRLDSLRAKEAKMAFAGNVDEASKSFVNLQYDIAKVCDELDILYAKKDQLERVSFGDAVKNAFNGIKEKAGIVTSFYSSIGKAFNGIKGVVGKVATQIKGLGNSIMDVVKKIPLLGGIVREMQGLGHRVSQLGKRMVHMLGLMVIRRALYQLLSEAKNGLGALAAYSNSIGSPFNANISNMIASLRALGYQMTAAFEPIFNYIAPALDFLISKLATAINYITMFFNAITGGTTWTKATKTAGNYGASVGGAGSAAKDAAGAQKELNQQLMAFDKLNVITTPKDSGGSGGGGGGGGGGAGNLFEPVYTTENIDENVKAFVDKVKDAWKKGDFSEIGKIIGVKIKKALDKIPWKPIQKTSEKIGKSIGTLIGGFVSVPGLAKSIGTSIGQAVNTVLLGLNKFFTSTPWDRVGIFLAEGIGSALLAKDKIHNKTMVENFFAVIKNALNSAAEMVYNFAKTFKWVDLGKSIASGIKDFLDRENGWDAYLAGASLGALVSGIANMVYTVVSDKKTWKDLGKKIADGINGVIDEMGKVNKDTGKTGWEALFGSVGSIASGILTTLREAISKIDWKKLIKDIAKGIGAAFKEMSVSDWMTALAIVGLPLLAKALKNKVISSIVGGGSGGKAAVDIGVIDIAVSGIKLVWSKVTGALAKLGTNIFNKIVSSISSGLGGGLSYSSILAGGGIALGIVVSIELIRELVTGDWDKDWFASKSNREKSISDGQKSRKTKAEKDGNKNKTSVDKSITKSQSDRSAYGTWGKAISQWIKKLTSSTKKSNSGSSSSGKNSIKGSKAVSVGVSLASKGWKTVSDWIQKPAQWGKKLDNKETSLGKKVWNNVRSWIQKPAQWGGNLQEKQTTLGKRTWQNVKTWIQKPAQWGTNLQDKQTTLGKKAWTSVKSWVEKGSQWGGNLQNKETFLGKKNWTSVQSWIQNKGWGGNLKKKETFLGKTNWGTVAKFVNKYPGGAVNKAVDLLRNGWSSVQQYTNWYSGGNADKAVDLYRNGWNTVEGWIDANGFIGNAVQIGVNLASNMASTIKNIFGSIFGKASGGIFYGGAWHSIVGYANGGYPTSAQLFMAREAGPELVGTIGSHTAVMNNGQIVDSVSAGVAQAVATYISPILREMGRENRYLAEIASKDFGVSSNDIFEAARSRGREYSMRTGQQAFVF